MKKRGFTLIELLAVIAILAILVVVAVPNVMKMYNSAKVGSFVNQAQNIYRAVNSQTMMNELESKVVTNFCYAKNGDNNPVKLSGNKNIYYSVETSDGKIVKLTVSTEEYSITLINPIEIDITDINKNEVSIKDNLNYQSLLNCEVSLAYTPDECFVTDLNSSALPDWFEEYAKPYYEDHAEDYPIDNDGLTVYYYDYENPVCTENVVIPNKINGTSIKAIGHLAFYRAEYIQSLVLPNDLIYIGYGTFANAFDSYSIGLTIPNKVEVIHDNAFVSKPFSPSQVGLNEKKIINVQKMGSWSPSGLINVLTFENGSTLESIGKSAFQGNNIAELILPESIINIGVEAFDSNNIAELILPGSITNIGDYAFAWNPLLEITFNNRPVMGQDVFSIPYCMGETETIINTPEDITFTKEELGWYEDCPV